MGSGDTIIMNILVIIFKFEHLCILFYQKAQRLNLLHVSISCIFYINKMQLLTFYYVLISTQY